jgi:hypothetical protein
MGPKNIRGRLRNSASVNFTAKPSEASKNIYDGEIGRRGDGERDSKSEAPAYPRQGLRSPK